MSFLGAGVHAATPEASPDVTNDTSRPGWGRTEVEEHDVSETTTDAVGERTHLSLVGGASLLGLQPGDEQWQELALCAQTDPESFFPEKGGSTREAKRICTGCEVRDACLEYALAHDERFGIWGGLSERERRRLKREAWDADAV